MQTGRILFLSLSLIFTAACKSESAGRKAIKNSIDAKNPSSVESKTAEEINDAVKKNDQSNKTPGATELTKAAGLKLSQLKTIVDANPKLASLIPMVDDASKDLAKYESTGKPSDKLIFCYGITGMQSELLVLASTGGLAQSDLASVRDPINELYKPGQICNKL